MPESTCKGPAAGTPVLARLHPDLVPLLDQLRPLVQQELPSTVWARYEQGVILRVAAKRRKNGMKALALAAGLPLTLARECARVAGRVYGDELAAFMAVAASSPSAGLCWAHLTALAQVVSPEDRATWLARTAAESLSAPELATALVNAGVARHRTGTRDGAGRPFKLPEDHVALVSLFERSTDSYARRCDQTFAALAASPGTLAPEGVEKLREVREVLIRLADDLAARLATAGVVGEESTRG